MNYQEFIRQIKKGDAAPVYFLIGTESYLVDRCVKALYNLWVDPTSKDFNFDVFYGGQSDAGKIIDIANSYPMLAEHRVVVVKDVPKIAAPGLEALAKYLQSPASSTKIILTGEKVDGRNKSLAKIKKLAAVVELKPLYDNQIPLWIQTELKQKGLDISHEASLLIHAYTGNNLQAIVNEIEKLQLNLDGKSKIDVTDVQKTVGLSRQYTIFNLNDAVGNKNLQEALKILNSMLSSGESPTGILAMLVRHFTNLLKIKGAVQAKKNQNEMVSLTGISPYFIQKTRTMAEKYPFATFQNIFQLLIKTELQLKTSKIQPDIALQTLLIQIIS